MPVGTVAAVSAFRIQPNARTVGMASEGPHFLGFPFRGGPVALTESRTVTDVCTMYLTR